MRGKVKITLPDGKTYVSKVQDDLDVVRGNLNNEWEGIILTLENGDILALDRYIMKRSVIMLIPIKQ